MEMLVLKTMIFRGYEEELGLLGHKRSVGEEVSDDWEGAQIRDDNAGEAAR